MDEFHLADEPGEAEKPRKGKWCVTWYERLSNEETSDWGCGVAAVFTGEFINLYCMNHCSCEGPWSNGVDRHVLPADIDSDDVHSAYSEWLSDADGWMDDNRVSATIDAKIRELLADPKYA